MTKSSHPATLGEVEAECRASGFLETSAVEAELCVRRKAAAPSPMPSGCLNQPGERNGIPVFRLHGRLLRAVCPRGSTGHLWAWGDRLRGWSRWGPGGDLQRDDSVSSSAYRAVVRVRRHPGKVQGQA